MIIRHITFIILNALIIFSFLNNLNFREDLLYYFSGYAVTLFCIISIVRLVKKILLLTNQQ